MPNVTLGAKGEKLQPLWSEPQESSELRLLCLGDVGMGHIMLTKKGDNS